MNTLIKTSNVTSITDVRSASVRLFAGPWRPLVNVITTLLCCDYFFVVECGIMHLLCAMRVFDIQA